MAQSDFELLKGFRGRVGDFVIYQYLGKTCIRRLPKKERVKMSPKMFMQQERIAGVATLWNAMKASGIQEIWVHAAEGMRMGGYALLVKRNLQAFSGKGNVCDFSKLTFTDGNLQLPDQMTLERGREGEFIFSWNNEEVPYPVSHEDDRLVIGWVKQEKGISIQIPEIGEWRRKDGRAVIQVPEASKGYPHLYCYFRSTTGKEVSKSKYFLIKDKYYGYI